MSLLLLFRPRAGTVPPIPGASRSMARRRSSGIQVGVYNVGGDAALVTDVPYKSLTWDHTLDGFGIANAVIENCSDTLLNAHPFTHELRVTDDGELAFAGPCRYVPLPLQRKGTMQIVAYDAPYWFALRFVHVNFDYTGAPQPISDIVNFIATNALSPVDPNLLAYMVVSPCATLHERKSRGVFDTAWRMHLETIVGKLMHMSVHGRSIRFFCIDDCLAQLPPVTVNQFKEFSSLNRDGDSFTTHAAVYGDEALGVEGSAGGVHPVWPVLIERLLEEDSYLDDDSAVAAATALVTDRARFSTATDGASSPFEAVVGCDAPWKFTSIAPGMCAAVSTAHGNLQLMVTSVSGSVSNGVATRKIGFEEVL